MTKIRYISKNANDQNIGFDEKEIASLKSLAKVNLPEPYLEFLKSAGKKSNALETEFKSIESLLNLQEEFKLEINKSEFIDKCENLWCLFKSNPNEYYFFNLEKEQNTIVYSFRKIDVPIDNGWNTKFGPIDKKTDFKEFIKQKTDKKFGMSIGKKIKKYTLLIVSLPFLIPFLIYLKIKMIRH